MITLSKLAKHKRTLWQRQSEWRYVIQVFPVTLEIFRKLQARQVNDIGPLWFEAMLREQDPGIEYIDIPIRLETQNDLSITLGPRATDSDRTIVEALVDRFAPGAVVTESELLGSIV